MSTNPLKKLTTFDQAIWLDYIKRDLITSGQLRKLIVEDDLRGMTSNPSIFEKAFSESKDYDQDIKDMLQQGRDINQIYEALTQKDICDAADEFRDLYQRIDGKDGYVSLEVNPHLAHDTAATVSEARRLWEALNRPNVFIKVPATMEGLAAITQLISQGINVNVTLLFGLPRYRKVLDAYQAGLEMRVARGEPIQHVASVASFFLSRIDVLVDPILEKIIAQGGEKSVLAKKIKGQVAIASAKIAYSIYKESINNASFTKLAQEGARPQRLLWASTSTKDPAYSDVKYVEALIGPNTVNTVPMETLEAYRDHGDPKLTLEQDVTTANWIFEQLPELGIDMDQVTQQLEEEGVDKFIQSFDKLMETLARRPGMDAGIQITGM